jgi:hypothetical protein
VFNAESSSKFSAADKCPAYRVPEDIANAVRNKQARDDAAIADLISRGTPAAPVAMGVDGGMNPTFLAAVKSHGGPGAVIRTASGTIPAHVNPPAEAPDTTGSFGSFMSLASSDSKPAAAPARSSSSSVQVASASSSGGIGSFFGNLFGSKEEDKADAKAAPTAGAPKSKPAAAPKAAPTAVAAAPVRAKPELASASSKPVSLPPAAKPAAPPPVQEASAAPKPTNTSSVMTGAAPTVPSNEFGNRFGAWQ